MMHLRIRWITRTWQGATLSQYVYWKSLFRIHNTWFHMACWI